LGDLSEHQRSSTIRKVKAFGFLDILAVNDLQQNITIAQDQRATSTTFPECFFGHNTKNNLLDMSNTVSSGTRLASIKLTNIPVNQL
jgi:hypothetical protein